MAAVHVERFLFTEGVATFHGDTMRLFSEITSHRLLLSRSGVAVPRTIYCATANRTTLDGYAALLGGFPLVANLGSEGGRGTIRIDSTPALYSTMAFCTDHGLVPELSGFIPDAMH